MNFMQVSCICENNLEDSKQPLLAPYLHARISRYLSNPSQVFELIKGLGSPLNFLFPENIADNIQSFKKVFNEHLLSGTIFFSSKPNKSTAVLRAAAKQVVNVDVSSLRSLQHALNSGFHPCRIQATGPKDDSYLILAIQLGILINADSIEELERIVSLKQNSACSKPTPVMLRLCGFKSDYLKFSELDSTFGVNVKNFSSIIEYLKQHKQVLQFEGFSFHLNSTNMNERILALENTLKLTLAARELGLHPNAINIGGGYRVNYVANPTEWQYFTEALKASVLGKRSSITWNGSGLGYTKKLGHIEGSPNFMDHCVLGAVGDDLCALLSSPMPMFDDIPAGRMISESMLELYIEPGRAMLDQVGATVAQVLDTKSSALGEQLVRLSMNRSNLNSSEHKLLTDPIVIPHNTEPRQLCCNGVYYVGNLCVHNELIQYKKHFCPFVPQKGDLVIFINTAAYMMDFVESETLRQPVARKVAIVEKNSSFEWSLDEIYQH